ncbi:MAG: hypothetical protein OXN17_07940 [Candidatus Poribacteria bacterium]|nr:hypothetical protein [Candidatus Poribacteria bacterium]
MLDNAEDKCFFAILTIYAIVTFFIKIPSDNHRLPWLVDRLGHAIPVAVALTVLIEIGGMTVMYFYERYKEKRDKALAEAYERGRESAIKEMQENLDKENEVKEPPKNPETENENE